MTGKIGEASAVPFGGGMIAWAICAENVRGRQYTFVANAIPMWLSLCMQFFNECRHSCLLREPSSSSPFCLVHRAHTPFHFISSSLFSLQELWQALSYPIQHVSSGITTPQSTPFVSFRCHLSNQCLSYGSFTRRRTLAMTSDTAGMQAYDEVFPGTSRPGSRHAGKPVLPGTERFGLSERRVCRLQALDRQTFRYRKSTPGRCAPYGRGSGRSPSTSDGMAVRGFMSCCGEKAGR